MTDIATTEPTVTHPEWCTSPCDGDSHVSEKVHLTSPLLRESDDDLSGLEAWVSIAQDIDYPSGVLGPVVVDLYVRDGDQEAIVNLTALAARELAGLLTGAADRAGVLNEREGLDHDDEDRSCRVNRGDT